MQQMPLLTSKMQSSLPPLAEGKFRNRIAVSREVPWALPYSQQDLRRKQLEDPDISPVMKWKEQDQRPGSEIVKPFSAATRHYWLNWESLVISDGLLFRCIKNKINGDNVNQLVLPMSIRTEVLKQMHDSLLGGHLGQKKTSAKVKQRFYWFEQHEDVNNWVAACDVCSAMKPPTRHPRAPMGVMTVGAIMDRLSTDILGPFPTTERGNTYILVVSDHFSKWVEIFPVADQTATTTARVILNEVIARFGCPYSILSDQGRNFESQLFADLCSLLEIRKTRTTLRNPQCNGQTERFNRTLLRMIKAYLKDSDEDWDQNLGCLAAAYRSTPHESTGMTPNALMLGREV